MQYKFLAVGNDRDGLVQYFGAGQGREAEAAAQVLSQSTGVASGVKRVELDEKSLLALMNSAVMLAKTRGVFTKGASNSG